MIYFFTQCPKCGRPADRGVDFCPWGCLDEKNKPVWTSVMYVNPDMHYYPTIPKSVPNPNEKQ